MPSIRSILCTLIPGLEKAYSYVRDTEARLHEADRDREHNKDLQEFRRRSEHAFADRNAAEAEHDRKVVHLALGSPKDEAMEVIERQCELERGLVERAGLRRLRETLFTAELPPESLGQVMMAMGSGQARLAAPGVPESFDGPGLAPQVDGETVERLAMLFVTRVGTASDPAERARLFAEWKDELRRQLPAFQAAEVEERARHLLSLVA